MQFEASRKALDYNQPMVRSSTFLSQMGGHLYSSQDEEEVFLQEILTELRGGSGGLETKNIREMFQLTLEWLRNIREDHHDLTIKIDEMKRALNKDIDKNERNILEQRSSSDIDSDGRPSGGSKRVRLKILQSLKSISEEEGGQSPNERTMTRKKSSRPLGIIKQASSQSGFAKEATFVTKEIIAQQKEPE